jgi:inorganic pyrophosphatase/exopolyphosphatase
MSINELMQELGKIVVVCADGRTSAAVAFELIKHNMNAVVLDGGMQSIPGKAVEVIDENETVQEVEEIAELLVAEEVDSHNIESSLLPSSCINSLIDIRNVKKGILRLPSI